MEQSSPATWSRAKSESAPGAPSDPHVDVSDSVLLPCLRAGKARGAKLGCSPSPAITQQRGQQALFSGEGARWAHVAGAQSLKETGFTFLVSLFVAVPPKLKKLKSPNVHVGEKISLKCEATAGNPQPSYKWFKDGKELKKSKDIRIKYGNGK